MLAGRFEESVRVGAEALPLLEVLGIEDQRARLHNTVGCARCGLGDAGGLDEIETSISIAEAAGVLEYLAIGYGNLSHELNFFARLADARHAWRRYLEVSERYGLGRSLRDARAHAAGWAYLDGRWDEAASIADELIAAADAGDAHYTDAHMRSLRAWIRFAREDSAGAEHDSAAAVAFARTADLQAQSAGYPIRAAIALAAGRRDEANGLASDVTALGPAILAALGFPFPTLADVAWIFSDLGRESDFREAVLDPDPIKSPWNDAARATCNGDFVQAADIIQRIGHTAGAAYARLRAAQALAAAGRGPEATAQREQAEAFYQNVGALRFVRDLETSGAASQASRRASSQS
jgi:hypothetical protein